MKQPKKLTYYQKIALAKMGLNWKEWSVKWASPDGKFRIVHNETGEEKTIDI